MNKHHGVCVKRLSIVVLSAGVLLLSSCDSTATKKAARPVPQALAPTIQKTPEPAMPTPSATPTQDPVSTPTPARQPEKADPVPAIIAEAEKEYQQGQEELKAGHMDPAKVAFNRAVDVLMQGSVDIKSDERLQAEFDKLTEEINKLETAAFKEGDGFTEQQPVPAPIDEANEVTPSADPNVKAKAEADLQRIQSDLPLMINDYVAGYINYFSNRGRGVFEGAWARSGKYREMILRIFKEEGVPQDLI